MYQKKNVSLLKRIFYTLTPYVNADEWYMARMLNKFHEDGSVRDTERRLVSAIQRNVAALNLWTEHRYKGYAYLSKSKRKYLYSNLALILDDFNKHNETHPQQPEKVLQSVERLPLNTVLARSEPAKLAFLISIKEYLRPERGLYVYRESSSFGRLLQDPAKNKLEGDCNQIVTLYVYLYATRYNVSDLQLVVYPEHVALEFNGVEIEATQGVFSTQLNQGARITPIHELVSINLLDTNDSYFQTHTVPAEAFLQAARLAYIVSSEREIVRKNLKVAYTNAVKELLEHNRFQAALSYAQQSTSKQLIETVGHNGALYYMQRHEYAKARHFAAFTENSSQLTKTISHNEGVHCLQSKKYHEALQAFRRAGEEDMVKRCYEGLYMREQNALSQVKTVAELKNHSATLARMKEYASKSGNARLSEHVSKLYKQLTQA